MKRYVVLLWQMEIGMAAKQNLSLSPVNPSHVWGASRSAVDAVNVQYTNPECNLDPLTYPSPYPYAYPYA